MFPLLLTSNHALHYQDDLIVGENVKVATKGRKLKFKPTNLPSGMNDNNVFRKMVIPTVYWHMGNQKDIWLYEDAWLSKGLKSICSAIYKPAQWNQKIEVDGPVFGVVSTWLPSIQLTDNEP